MDFVSTFLQDKEALENKKCTDCRGLGYKDDAEPGDISYNEWYCKTCNATGYDPNHEAIRECMVVLSILRHSPNRVPYTYHHDYLRNRNIRFKEASRSDVAEARRNCGEYELYVLCTAQVILSMDVKDLLTRYDCIRHTGIIRKIVNRAEQVNKKIEENPEA